MENNHVVEYERALLGAFLVNENLFHNFKGRLEASDFYEKKNGII